MSLVLEKLIEAASDEALFITPTQSFITAGDVRRAAWKLASGVSADVDGLYVYTRGVSGTCAAILAAAKLGKTLTLLPQAGSEYLSDLGIPEAALISDTDIPSLHIDFKGHEEIQLSDQQIAQDVSLAFLTSGSTGTPKLIEKPASIIEAEVSYWLKRFSGQIDRVAGTVSHQHIYGMIFRLTLPVMAGWVAKDEMSVSWEALMDTMTPRSLIVSSPAHLTRLPDTRSVDVVTPAAILSSGGPLSPEAAFEVKEILGVLPIEILGSTETGGVAWRQRHQTDEPWAVLDNVQITLGENNELQVASDFIQNCPVAMGDSVAFEEDGRFRLTGRVDRIVKIEGKRVSLPRVENALLSHDLVTDSFVLVTKSGARERLSALVCLTPEGQMQLGLLGAFKFSRQLRADLADQLEPAERPKRWRFIPEIPVNSQSKRIKKDLEQIFDTPRVVDMLADVDLSVDGFSAVLKFGVSADLPWFQGHFQGSPVLPGLAQTYMAERLAEEIWSVKPGSANINRMKFQKVVLPKQSIELKLGYNPESCKLTYSFIRGNDKLSSGVIG